jgi:uncharacterized surface protein with fasciclin (FAS1) repeats
MSDSDSNNPPPVPGSNPPPPAPDSPTDSSTEAPTTPVPAVAPTTPMPTLPPTSPVPTSPVPTLPPTTPVPTTPVPTSPVPTSPAAPFLPGPPTNAAPVGFDPPTPEPIFIAEQTPVPPTSDPVIPATTPLPAVPTGSGGPVAGGPFAGEPTSVMPPVAAGAAPPPGGPGGPIGPDADEPDKPWYRKPGPIAVAVIVVALLAALVAWLLTSGRDDEGDSIVIVSVETSVPSTSVADVTSTAATESTVEVTTTAAPETTEAPESTEPPDTTVAPTTTEVTATTTTIPEIIPEPGETVWDVIEREPELSELQRLIELAGLQAGLQDPGSTYTLFAPTNDAITAALEDLGDPEDIDQEVLQNLLLSHLNDVDAIQQAELITLTEVPVVFGGPQQVDGAAKPPTIGGARILVQAAPTANGIIYAIDEVLQPVAD